MGSGQVLPSDQVCHEFGFISLHVEASRWSIAEIQTQSLTDTPEDYNRHMCPNIVPQGQASFKIGHLESGHPGSE